VDQPYQGAGIGTALIRALLGHGARAGIEYVWLTVERWNRAAVALYEKVGFETASAESFELEMAAHLADPDADTESDGADEGDGGRERDRGDEGAEEDGGTERDAGAEGDAGAESDASDGGAACDDTDETDTGDDFVTTTRGDCDGNTDFDTE